MKTCPYCGKENSDDATVCVIDGQSLLPEAPSISSKPSRREVRAHMVSRPLAVKIGVGILATYEAFDTIRLGVFRYQAHSFRHSGTYFSIAVTFAFMALILYYTFRGKNWARWTVLLLLVIGTLGSPLVLIGRLHWDFYFYTALNIVAVAALFQRSSNEWYKGPKKVSDQSLSTQFV